MVNKGDQHQHPTSLDLRIDLGAKLEIVHRVQVFEVFEEHIAVPLPDLDTLLQ
jgi:hypothetical protein